MCSKIVPCLLILLFAFAGQAQIISTVAGNGGQGYNGDSIQAIDAELYSPNAVTADDSGNFFIADMISNRVRKVDKTGLITTVAGNGYTTSGYLGAYSGDGGPADSAELYWPACVAFDSKHNMYIADAGNNCIRKVNTSGIISTFAGTAVYGFSGDGGPATAARLFYPSFILFDKYGNLLIVDCDNNRVRKVDTTGIITTIAGNGYGAGSMTGGYSGDGGPADSASLHAPYALAIDKMNNILIADMNNNCIRKLSPSGIISTIAGNDTVAGYNGDHIPATAARLCAPGGLAIDTAGNIFIADAGNDRIREITADGIITTFAGTGIPGFSGDGGDGTDARFFSPEGIALDNYGNMYIADAANYRIRLIANEAAGIHKLPSSQSFTLFPNPSHGNFSILIPENTEPATIMVCNMENEAIYLKTGIKPPVAQIDLSGKPPGVYLVRMCTGKNWVQGEVLIE